MRVVLQRVRQAAVRLPDGSPPRVSARIGAGLCALVAFSAGEAEGTLEWMAAKLSALRIFPGEGGDMDRSLRDAGGELLVVSQFTLYGDTRKGRRPDFMGAAPYAQAERLFDRFLALCEAQLPGRVAAGVFGARMEVSLVNDGPVTLILER